MTPREQIEWIRDDMSKLVAERLELPAVVYLVAVADHNALVDSTHSASGAKPNTTSGRMWLCVGTRSVEVISDASKPAGLVPSRCFRCPCGELFLDDSSRRGQCSVCREWDPTVRVIRTPVGDIPVHADPTLGPDEFRIESGPPRPSLHAALVNYVAAHGTSSLVSIDGELPLFAPAVGSESTALLPPDMWQGATRSLRPDGFAQSRIDEIKAMLLAPAPKVKR